MLAFAIAVIGPFGWLILRRGLAYIPEVRTGFGAFFAYGATISGALIVLAALGGVCFIVVKARHRLR
ncbi:MAG: hypothetical protein RLO50_06585 [Azospirillaceae bacterium]